MSQLVAVASQTQDEGLPPESAAVNELAALQEKRAREQAPLSNLTGLGDQVDRRANALFDRIAEDYAAGRVDPELADPTWRFPRPSVDADDLRRGALANGDVARTLRALLPQNAEYGALRDELARMRQGGDAGRIMVIRANMERWRWMPRVLPADRIEVRTPFFALRLYQNDAVTFERRVVVGAQGSKTTPSFETAMQAVTLNPYWTPPQSILTRELLPEFRRDARRLAQSNYEVLDAHGGVVDPATIDWNAKPFPYQVRQKPGPNNALGQLKFEMPNPYAVYIHDTPSKGLFERDVRAFSHGCIRLQDPLGLAAALGVAPSEEALAAQIAIGETQTIPLAKPAPVYVMYMTAELDPAGALVIAPDIYRRDAKLVRMLDAEDRAQAVASADTAILISQKAPAAPCPA